VKRVQSARRNAPAEGPAGSRKACILDAAFTVLMERGYAGASTLEIARRAKVSKRELYADFGNKQGILAALIAARAERMRAPLALPAPRDAASFRETLVQFGAGLLREVCHPAVTAIFRLAVAEAEASPEVARVLDSAGRVGTRRAFHELLVQAQAAGLIGPGQPAAMAEQYFALLWGDLQVRRLLGLADPPTPSETERRATAAAEGLLVLNPVAGIMSNNSTD
jgi:AcrR family transcriptional regulator